MRSILRRIEKARRNQRDSCENRFVILKQIPKLFWAVTMTIIHLITKGQRKVKSVERKRDFTCIIGSQAYLVIVDGEVSKEVEKRILKHIALRSKGHVVQL